MVADLPMSERAGHSQKESHYDTYAHRHRNLPEAFLFRVMPQDERFQWDLRVEFNCTGAVDERCGHSLRRYVVLVRQGGHFELWIEENC